jgi:predicted transcriptional regulator
MEILSNLFGSEAKVKIIKLFLFNTESSFEIKEISRRTKISGAKVKKEIAILQKIGLIKKKHPQKRKSGYVVNYNFAYFNSLKNFLVTAEPFTAKEIIKKVSKSGSIKLIVLAGVFMQQQESRADLLIVGDNIRNIGLENTIRNFEIEIGKELKYAYFTTADFKYRLSMCDKLTSDILDYPHKKILNKLSIE